MTTSTLREQIFSRRLSILLHLGIWGSVLLTVLLISMRFWDFGVALLRTFANIGPAILLFYLNTYLVTHYLEQKKFWQYTIFILILLAAFIIFRVTIGGLFPDARKAMSEIPTQQTWQITAFVVGLGTIYTSILYQMLHNAHRKTQQNQSIIQEQQEAQVKFLRGQINPHFLFNTLNNIYSLAVVRSEKTASMVLKLSNLLRYVIYTGQEEQVSLIREVNHIHSFIELFQMRSETPNDIVFEKHQIEEGILLEPMILIPIVENAFKHSDIETNPEGFIRIDLEVIQNNLYFRTLNSTDKRNQQKDQTGGVGLPNIKKRLQLRYGGRHQLLINEEENTFEVKLLLALDKNATIVGKVLQDSFN